MVASALRPMACVPLRSLPDGIIGVPIDPFVGKRLASRDLLDRARIFSQIVTSYGLMIKVGPFAFVANSSREYIDIYDSNSYMIYSGIVKPAPSSDRDAKDVALLGRILSDFTTGITFSELCRGNFGCKPVQQKNYRESLRRLTVSKLLRQDGSRYILTAAGVKKAMLEGYSFSPAARP